MFLKFTKIKMSEELHNCQSDLSLMSDKLKERSLALIEMKGVQRRDVQVQFNKDCGENNTVKSAIVEFKE